MLQKHQSGEVIKQRYKIDRILGKRGMGITYGAIDLETDANVAIKAVSLKKLIENDL